MRNLEEHLFWWKCVSETIVIRNGNNLETRAVLLIFSLKLEISGVPHRAHYRTTKSGDFCEELLSENGIEVVLSTFCCYDYGAKASEAVQKIATDQEEYRKCSLYVIICWVAKIYLAINQSSNKEWKMVGYKDTPDVAKKAAEVTLKKEQ